LSGISGFSGTSDPGGGKAAKETITQVGHGFAAGMAIYRGVGSYAKAKADSIHTADVVGIVESVSGNDFTVVYEGRISGLSGLTDGETYFLSATVAGDLTSTEPTTAGLITKPMMVATSTTSGIVINHRGVTIVSQGSTLSIFVTQNGHGLVAGNVLYLNGTTWTKAKADAAATAEAIGIVESVYDANSFWVVLAGRITLSGLTAGDVYYLSPSVAGGYTNTAPTTSGQIRKPLFVAESATVAVLNIMLGFEVDDRTYRDAFVNGDLAAGILTVNHALGQQYVVVDVYDNSNKRVIPDDVTLTDSNNLTIDLSSYGAIAGTWNAVIVK
jgi:hypothetical protein